MSRYAMPLVLVPLSEFERTAYGHIGGGSHALFSGFLRLRVVRTCLDTCSDRATELCGFIFEK